jgi:hypothetical protein
LCFLSGFYAIYLLFAMGVGVHLWQLEILLYFHGVLLFLCIINFIVLLDVFELFHFVFMVVDVGFDFSQLGDPT